MQVLSASTADWVSQAAPQQDANGITKPDPAEVEARRLLSDVFRCQNLVVLAGLGTSLCLRDAQGQMLAPTMGALWERVRNAQTAAAQQAQQAGQPAQLQWADLLALVHHDPADTNLETLLSRCRLAEQFLAGDQLARLQEFIALAEGEIYGAVNFLVPGQQLPAHTEFLRRIARRSNRRSRTKIFTTNYDRCFEEAARQGRYVVIDGFSQTVPPTFDAVHFTYDIVRRDRDSEATDFIPNVFHLYKLHGSIDWERDLESSEIHKKAAPSQPLLIYPRSSKFELAFEQPYLEMMSALQGALREPNTGLVVIGFGFNDRHLAEPILSGVRSNLSLKLVAVSPNLSPRAAQQGVPAHEGEAATNGHLKMIRDLAKRGDARLSLINATFEELVPLIPDLVAESDLEKHVERIRKLGEVA